LKTSDPPVLCMYREIVQRHHSLDHRGQRLWDRRIARVREVLFALHHILMNLGVKCVAHLPHVSLNSITVRPAATLAT